MDELPETQRKLLADCGRSVGNVVLDRARKDVSDNDDDDTHIQVEHVRNLHVGIAQEILVFLRRLVGLSNTCGQTSSIIREASFKLFDALAVTSSIIFGLFSDLEIQISLCTGSPPYEKTDLHGFR